MNAIRVCSCGRVYSEADFEHGSLGFSIIPAGEKEGEDAYALEQSNPCPCGSTLAREIPIWQLESLLRIGVVDYVPGDIIAKRVRGT